jgi:hypothetical protein
MTIELAGINLTQLTQVTVQEQTRIAHHAVPGMAGDLAQVLGRPSVVVEFQGIFYGETATADLQQLRDAQLDQQPVDFFTAAIGEGFFTQVLIKQLQVAQRVGYPNQFDFQCQVVEYVEPPDPIAASPFGDIDTGLLDDATAFMDDVQNAIDQVSDLASLIANAPDFGNPTAGLNQMLDDYTGTVESGIGVLQSIRTLFVGG